MRRNLYAYRHAEGGRAVNEPELRKSNRLCLLLLILGIALTMVLMNLPLYSFDVDIYKKKSPNTFVGDEKYQEVMQQVQAVADEYR